MKSNEGNENEVQNQYGHMESNCEDAQENTTEK